MSNMLILIKWQVVGLMKMPAGYVIILGILGHAAVLVEAKPPWNRSQGEKTSMATIVLVHGIAQEQEAADTLESEWLPALAGGVRAAGYPAIADCLWRDRAIAVRMAFYGGRDRRPDQQGEDPGDLDEAEATLAELLAVEWLERAAERALRPREKATAVRELAYVRHAVGAEEAGSGAVGLRVATEQKVGFRRGQSPVRRYCARAAVHRGQRARAA